MLFLEFRGNLTSLHDWDSSWGRNNSINARRIYWCWEAWLVSTSTVGEGGPVNLYDETMLASSKMKGFVILTSPFTMTPRGLRPIHVLQAPKNPMDPRSWKTEIFTRTIKANRDGNCVLKGSSTIFRPRHTFHPASKMNHA